MIRALPIDAEGDLDSRLMHMRRHPWDNIEFF